MLPDLLQQGHVLVLDPGLVVRLEEVIEPAVKLNGGPLWQHLADLDPVSLVELLPDEEQHVLGLGEGASLDDVLEAVDVALVALLLGPPVHVEAHLRPGDEIIDPALRNEAAQP